MVGAPLEILHLCLHKILALYFFVRKMMLDVKKKFQPSLDPIAEIF
jgi:hypothetical protein